MGIDLAVMTSYFRERGGEIVPTATLRFDRDTRLFGQLAATAAHPLVRPLPDGLKVGSYQDEGLRFVDADRYGSGCTTRSRSTCGTTPSLRSPTRSSSGSTGRPGWRRGPTATGG